MHIEDAGSPKRKPQRWRPAFAALAALVALIGIGILTMPNQGIAGVGALAVSALIAGLAAWWPSAPGQARGDYRF